MFLLLQQKAKTWQQHTIANVGNAMAESYRELTDIYEDKDGLMAMDLESMKGANMFSSFYETLKNVSEYNHKFPDAGDGNQIDLERVAHVSILSCLSFHLNICLHLWSFIITGECAVLWRRSIWQIFGFESIL